MLSVIIPAYNEERTLAAVLERVLASPVRPEVIVVSDGSTDSTPRIVRKYQLERGIIGVIDAVNRGKGAAIRAGLEWATRKYTLIQDADLEYFPEEYPALLEPVIRGRAEVVFGSRNLRHPAARKNKFAYLRFWLGGKIVTLAANLLFGTHLTDEPTCYKLFPTRLLRQMNLQCDGFDFCAEATGQALRRGWRIVEVPIQYAPRDAAAGKKIRARDGIKAVGVLLKQRWLPIQPARYDAGRGEEATVAVERRIEGLRKAG